MAQLFDGMLTFAWQAPAANFAPTDELAETTAATEEVVSAPESIPAATLPGISNFSLFVIMVVVLVLPFVAAWFLARALKVQDWAGRISVVLFTIALGASPFLASILEGRSISERFRLGIDLAGGTNMVFQVRPEGKELNDQVMDRMVGAVSQRINRSGTEEVTVRRVGRDRIEVIVPGEDPQTVDEIKRQITRLGSLEFFICADNTDQQIVRLANELDKSQKVLEIDGEIVARWVQAFEKNGVPKRLERDAVRRTVQMTREVNGRLETYETEEYLLLVDPPDEQVTGKYLRSAAPDFDQNGAIVVSFTFDATGGYLFGQLTGRNKPRAGVPKRKLAIVLDRMVFSAPDINEQITTRGQISGGAGGFTREEADELSNVLNAGALEVPIDQKPLSEATVDPTLGADVRNKGVRATMVSGVAVIVFMLFYYRFAGVVAVISLLLNMLFILSIMVAINATFTLPGIAGIVLTIGMAVDANVLIYERIREELSKGSSLRLAIQNGFEKAFSTIFDSNITSLLTAVILFVIGTDTIKGFAVTLFIGLAVSMYTVLFVGRLIFDICERRKILRNLQMRQMVGKTRFDFLKHRVIWCGISVVAIAVGMMAFFARGAKNYDIDFTGGTMVSFQTTELQKTEDLKKALDTQFKGDFTLERLTLDSETEEGVGHYFRLRSTESDAHTESSGGPEEKSAEERVREKVYLAFQDHPTIRLRMVTLEFTEVTSVTVAEGDESPQALARMPFRGGSEATLTFSEEVAAGTVSDLLGAALGSLQTNGEPKYRETDGLYGLEGLEGSGLTTGERNVKKFSKLAVRVVADVAAEDLTAALTAISEDLSERPLFDEVNTFASAVASEMKQSAILAIVLSMAVISVYIWFRFQNAVFGLAAVVALIHDVLICVGSLAVAGMLYGTSIGNLLLLEDFRINLPMIAAFLTLVGYSLNDTIVMFDRIREIRGKSPDVTVSMVNQALNETLSRTLLTALTTLLVVLILYAFGGAGVHGFAWCLLIGCFAGTYSSIYVASPILIWVMNRTRA